MRKRNDKTELRFFFASYSFEVFFFSVAVCDVLSMTNIMPRAIDIKVYNIRGIHLGKK